MYLGEQCLDNWLTDKTDVVLPDSISAIGTGVFYDLPDLENVVLPAKLATLSPYSFNATGIKELFHLPSLKYLRIVSLTVLLQASVSRTALSI